jgi:hypothetical protein
LLLFGVEGDGHRLVEAMVISIISDEKNDEYCLCFTFLLDMSHSCFCSTIRLMP